MRAINVDRKVQQAMCQLFLDMILYDQYFTIIQECQKFSTYL